MTKLGGVLDLKTNIKLICVSVILRACAMEIINLAL